MVFDWLSAFRLSTRKTLRDMRFTQKRSALEETVFINIILNKNQWKKINNIEDVWRFGHFETKKAKLDKLEFCLKIWLCQFLDLSSPTNTTNTMQKNKKIMPIRERLVTNVLPGLLAGRQESRQAGRQIKER